MSKPVVAVLYGGKSAEHDVSLQTAFSVMNALDKNKYHLVPIHISNSGKWSEGHEITETLEYKEQLLLDENRHPTVKSDWLTPARTGPAKRRPDVVFPLLHGPNGEDGTVQGLLQLIDVAYVGSGVLGSAAGMDKVVMKDIFKSHGLDQAAYMSVTRHEWETRSAELAEKVGERLGFPCFVKPANLGSSIGISQPKSRDELAKAMTEAFKYDLKVVIEEKITGREIEMGVIGNWELEVSVPGEIVSNADFYDYGAKYQDGSTSLIIPADVDDETAVQLEQTAKKAFEVLNCNGLARCDFFVAEDGRVLINEVNTMPGFTPYSMFPLLWKHTGLPYDELINKLIRLGIERHQERQTLTYRIESPE